MIPASIKRELQKDGRMQKCEICKSYPVQWHHVFTYAGRQIQDAWNIAAACKTCHDMATPHKNEYIEGVRERFELNAIRRMETQDKRKYFKKDWSKIARYIQTKQDHS